LLLAQWRTWRPQVVRDFMFGGDGGRAGQGTRTEMMGGHCPRVQAVQGCANPTRARPQRITVQYGIICFRPRLHQPTRSACQWQDHRIPYSSSRGLCRGASSCSVGPHTLRDIGPLRRSSWWPAALTVNQGSVDISQQPEMVPKPSFRLSTYRRVSSSSGSSGHSIRAGISDIKCPHVPRPGDVAALGLRAHATEMTPRSDQRTTDSDEDPNLCL
jgi:hypothetical protein